MPLRLSARRRRYPAGMGTLHVIEYRRDARTRYLVEAGQLLVPTHGWRLAVHFMLTYGVPVAVILRVLERS